jgi:hypothetical protein
MIPQIKDLTRVCKLHCLLGQYREMLEAGVCPEQARRLPTAVHYD